MSLQGIKIRALEQRLQHEQEEREEAVHQLSERGVDTWVPLGVSQEPRGPLHAATHSNYAMYVSTRDSLM